MCISLFAENNNTKGYPILTMSRDDEMCQHFYKIFYDDMHQHNGYMPELHKEFMDVPWEKINVVSELHTIYESKTAKIDINNDSKKEFILLLRSSGYSGSYWYESIEGLRWFDLNKSTLLRGKVIEPHTLNDLLGRPIKWLNTNSTLELFEFPMYASPKHIIKDYYVKNYPLMNLDYEGLRIATYKDNYYLVFFGLRSEIDYAPKSKVNKKIKDKTIIVISRYTPTNERQDVCYYLTVK
jgi:hypothetical protein